VVNKNNCKCLVFKPRLILSFVAVATQRKIGEGYGNQWLAIKSFLSNFVKPY